MQGSRTVDPAASQEYVVRRAPSPLGTPDPAASNFHKGIWADAAVGEIKNWDWPDPKCALRQPPLARSGRPLPPRAPALALPRRSRADHCA